MDVNRKEVLNAVMDTLHADLMLTPTFFDMLLQYDVVTEEVKEQLQEEKMSQARSQFISVLKKCGNEQYDAFLHILRLPEIRQGHVADRLEAAEVTYKDKNLTRKVKNNIQVFVTEHYLNGRHFTPMEENIITKSLVKEDDYMEQAIQNEMHIKASRKLKQEVLRNQDKIKEMSASHLREIQQLQRRMRETDSELNQYKCTLEEQVKKCDHLQEQLVTLEHNKDARKPHKAARGDLESAGNHGNTRGAFDANNKSSDTYFTDNRARENREELARTRTELKQLQKKYDLHQKALGRLNEELSQFINSDTSVKESGDPLKALQRKILALGKSLNNSDTNVKSTFGRHGDMGSNSGSSIGVSNSSIDKLQDKLKREKKEKSGLRKTLEDVRQRLRDAQMVIHEMSNSSESSGSRRASIAWSRRGSIPGSAQGVEQTDGAAAADQYCRPERRLPVIPPAKSARAEPSYAAGRTVSAPVSARAVPLTLQVPAVTYSGVQTARPGVRTAPQTPTTPVLRQTEFKILIPDEFTGCARTKPVYAAQRPFQRS